MSINYNPSVVTSGMILCLDAGNKRSYLGSGAEWFDISGNSFHMSLKNTPTFVNVGPASYFDLDGTDDYGSCDGTIPGSISATVSNLAITGSSPKSVVCVAMVDNGVGSLSAGLFDMGDTGVAGQHFCLRLNASYTAWRAQFWSTPDYDFTYDSTGVWTMFSTVYGTDKIGRTYGNDGTLLGEDSGPFDMVTSGARPFEMARYNGGSYFGGKIAFYAVYSKGLSVTEIQQNFRALRGRYGI